MDAVGAEGLLYKYTHTRKRMQKLVAGLGFEPRSADSKTCVYFILLFST